MRKFDYSFLNNGMLPANLVNLTSNIAALKTMTGVRKEEYTQIFTELEAVAKVQSIKSSNAIEGIVTSDERIAAIVNQNSAPLNHNEAEIAGYRDALNEIHLGYEHIDFRQSDTMTAERSTLTTAPMPCGCITTITLTSTRIIAWTANNDTAERAERSQRTTFVPLWTSWASRSPMRPVLSPRTRAREGTLFGQNV